MRPLRERTIFNAQAAEFAMKFGSKATIARAIKASHFPYARQVKANTKYRHQFRHQRRCQTSRYHHLIRAAVLHQKLLAVKKAVRRRRDLRSAFPRRGATLRNIIGAAAKVSAEEDAQG